jgi:hypothetical protein
MATVALLPPDMLGVIADFLKNKLDALHLAIAQPEMLVDRKRFITTLGALFISIQKSDVSEQRACHAFRLFSKVHLPPHAFPATQRSEILRFVFAALKSLELEGFVRISHRMWAILFEVADDSDHLVFEGFVPLLPDWRGTEYLRDVCCCLSFVPTPRLRLECFLRIVQVYARRVSRGAVPCVDPRAILEFDDCELIDLDTLLYVLVYGSVRSPSLLRFLVEHRPGTLEAFMFRRKYDGARRAQFLQDLERCLEAAVHVSVNVKRNKSLDTAVSEIVRTPISVIPVV